MGRNWVSSIKLSDLVQEFGNLDYTPICSISKVGTKNASKALSYTLKPQELQEEYLKELDTQLAHLKLLSFGGIYKELRKKFISQSKQANSLKARFSDFTNLSLYSIPENQVEDFLSFDS